MGWVVNATLRPLNPRDIDPVSIIWEAGWVLESVWMVVENLAPKGIPFPESPTQGINKQNEKLNISGVYLISRNKDSLNFENMKGGSL
jgi:hypothetical protein